MSSASKRHKKKTLRKFQRVVNGKEGKGRQEPSAEGDPHSLRQLAVDRGYVLFFSASDMSTLTLFKKVQPLAAVVSEKKNHDLAPRSSSHQPLLWLVEARLTKLESDQAATKFYVLHNVGPGQAAVTFHGSAGVDKSGDCGGSEDSKGSCAGIRENVT